MPLPELDPDSPNLSPATSLFSVSCAVSRQQNPSSFPAPMHNTPPGAALSSAALGRHTLTPWRPYDSAAAPHSTTATAQHQELQRQPRTPFTIWHQRERAQLATRTPSFTPNSELRPKRFEATPLLQQTPDITQSGDLTYPTIPTHSPVPGTTQAECQTMHVSSPTACHLSLQPSFDQSTQYAVQPLHPTRNEPECCAHHGSVQPLSAVPPTAYHNYLASEQFVAQQTTSLLQPCHDHGTRGYPSTHYHSN